MIVASSLIAMAAILGQLIALFGFLRFVKSFGAYTASQKELTAALLYTHESNLIVHQANLRILEELRKVQVTTLERKHA